MTRLVPPVYFLLCVGAMLLLHRSFPGARVVSGWLFEMGIGVIGFAVILGISAVRLFHRRGTTVKPLQKPDKLVTEGVYRYSRNPMYLALVLAAAGIALLLGSASPWLAVISLFIVLDRVFVQKEEALLAEYFGSVYAEYCKQVRRWL
ncbi:MAG TPA: isoprenylcysteine carboxylmethyltransferase family protein [Candidatus Hydrogenedentes bacterium]|nr:isoprenylcysteine carboxylmethyltransferase family protein [Candidatus Hydrogenedentota bacterium]HOL77842.1 isoprenylcysteine carboxylmethyltransferase family protein [Candidatus Hydrogenedentota bacterium]HPO86187.1 isoprenylcysteine carboxylmethyltransferase family protein [Candidatus Hydrogenedentota bacterium]